MKYTNFDNIKIVVDLLKRHNISNLVISPGGTNISLINAVQNDVFFNCYSVVDERSAAYYAIGISLQKHEPVVLICTSAQATRNYVPGLTEAFYKKVPILAITMEKHPRFKYQEYMQAPDQTSLPKDSVKESFELPFVSDINDMQYSIRLVNQAILELTKDGSGPVQLAIPWVDFPLKEITPKIRMIQRYKCSDIQSYNFSKKKILIVIGEHTPFNEVEKNAINNFCEKTNAVIYTNHLSNFNSEYSIKASLLLLTISKEELNEIKPDIFITIGGQTGDYPLFLAFSRNDIEGIEHWRVSEDGNVVDTYDKLTRVYQGSILDFFTNVIGVFDKIDGYRELWLEKKNKRIIDKELPFSNILIASILAKEIPHNSIIQFSILNSLRTWSFYDLDSSIECYSNVGAFGIDGGMSTLIGQSVVTNKLCFMIVGDLAFFYDMNCLGIRDIKNNVRILLVNNNGGVEFKIHGENKNERDKFIAAANHYKSAKGWAESCGFKYLTAYNADEFRSVCSEFISVSDKPILLEAFVSDVDEYEAYNKIVSRNTHNDISTSLNKSAKDALKTILGEERYNGLKKIVKK